MTLTSQLQEKLLAGERLSVEDARALGATTGSVLRTAVEHLRNEGHVIEEEKVNLNEGDWPARMTSFYQLAARADERPAPRRKRKSPRSRTRTQVQASGNGAQTTVIDVTDTTPPMPGQVLELLVTGLYLDGEQLMVTASVGEREFTLPWD